MAITDWRWAFSLVTKATLIGSDSYCIVNFPRQTGQLTPWFIWNDNSEVIHPAEYFSLLDASQGVQGDLICDLYQSYLGEEMYAYLLTNQWPGNIQFANCTLQLRIDDSTFQAYQGIMLRPRVGKANQDMTRGDSGWNDVLFRFRAGVLIT